MTRASLLFTGIVLAVLATIFVGGYTAANPPGVVGTISAIDKANESIQIVSDGPIEWFGCTSKTAITLNELPATFQQLAIGHKVTVEYDAATHHATRVSARTDTR